MAVFLSGMFMCSRNRSDFGTMLALPVARLEIFGFVFLTAGCCCPRKGAFLLFYAIDLLVCHPVFSEDRFVGCTLKILSEQERVQCYLRGRNPLYSKRIQKIATFLPVFRDKLVVRCHAVQGFARIAIKIREHQIHAFLRKHIEGRAFLEDAPKV